MGFVHDFRVYCDDCLFANEYQGSRKHHAVRESAIVHVLVRELLHYAGDWHNGDSGRTVLQSWRHQRGLDSTI